MGNNPKSYDQAFKALSDADPRGLLGIFGVLPLGVKAEVEPLPRDLSMRPLVIDSGYLVRRPRRRPYIVLFEAVTSWKSEIAERLAWYGAFLGHKYELPVHVHVVPFTRESCPRRPPVRGRAKRGGVTVEARLHWIKPWEIDARVVLDLRSKELDAWAVLFRLSDAQLDETVTRLHGHLGSAPLFRILGGMRYRKNRAEWEALLERMDRMIRPELLRESLAVQEWLEEGRAEGLEKGLEKGLERGMAEGLQDSLSAILSARFPDLRTPASIRSIADKAVLNALIRKVAVARNADAAVRAIERASKRASH